MDYQGYLFVYFLVYGTIAIIIGFVCGKVAESIATQKGLQNTTMYFWLGFFFTIIGIIVAAVQQDNNNSVRTVEIKHSSVADLRGYKELLDSGAITQEEYDKKKKELLG